MCKSRPNARGADASFDRVIQTPAAERARSYFLVFATIGVIATGSAVEAAVIATQGFETGDTWTISGTPTNGTISTATGGGDTPSGQRILSGSRSYQQIGPASGTKTGTLNLSSFAITGNYTGLTITIRLSSTSVTTGNGIDAGDFLNAFVAYNGANFGTTPDISLEGNGNARYGYNATKTARTLAGIPIAVTATAGQSLDNYSTFSISLPAGTSSAALRLVTVNNSDSEIWNVDDITLTGNLVDPGARSIWDGNGAAAGSGNTGGNFNDATWTSDSAGSSATGAFTTDSVATFAAGTDNRNITVNVTSATSVGGLDFQEGSVNLAAAGGTLTLTDPTVSVAGSASATIRTSINSSVGLVKQGAGKLILTGDNSSTLTGGVVVGSGTLQIGKGGTTGTVGDANIMNGGTVAFNRSNASSYGGVISGTGNVVKAGSGTLTVSGANTYTGTTTVAGGGLQLAASGTIESSNLVLAGGTFSLAANHIASNTSGLTISSGASSISATTLLSSSTNFAFGAFSRAAGATLDVTLPTSGNLRNTTVGVNGIVGGYATANGGTTWLGRNGTNSSQNLTSTVTYNSSYSTAAATLANANFDATANGTFLGNSVYSLRFNSGAADVTATLRSGANTLSSGGILVTPTVAMRTSTITGGTSLTSGNGSDLIVHQYSNGTLNIETPITGTIGLTKSGPGTLNLSASNDFSGTTSVNAGTLKLTTATSSNLASAKIVVGRGATLDVQNVTGNGGFALASGQTLAGSGTVSGKMTVGSGSTLSAGSGAARATAVNASAGDSVGLLSTGDQTWNAGGTAVFKFASNETTAGTDFDSINMGSLNLGGLDGANKFSIVLTRSVASSFLTPVAGTVFKLIDASDGVTDGTNAFAPNTVLYGNANGIGDLFVLNTSDLGIDNSYFTLSTGDGTGDELLLTYSGQSPAPEPTTAALFGLAGSVMLGRRRRGGGRSVLSVVRRSLFGPGSGGTAN